MGEGLDYLSRANMKVFLFSLLFVACSAQRGAFLKEILNGDLNPCGAGVKPTTCTCADGTTVGPGQARFRGAGLKGPCGDCSPPATCTCPDGSEQNMPTASDVKEQLKSRVLTAQTTLVEQASASLANAVTAALSPLGQSSTTSNVGNDPETLAAVDDLPANVPTENHSVPGS